MGSIGLTSTFSKLNSFSGYQQATKDIHLDVKYSNWCVIPCQPKRELQSLWLPTNRSCCYSRLCFDKQRAMKVSERPKPHR